MTNHIATMLEELAEIRAALALTRADYVDRQREVMAPVQADLDSLAAEYGPMLEAAEARATGIEERIREEVKTAGETVKGGGLMAVYARGRETWDSKRLGGYAAAHPEIMAFQKVGEPSVSIRPVK